MLRSRLLLISVLLLCGCEAQARTSKHFTNHTVYIYKKDCAAAARSDVWYFVTEIERLPDGSHKLYKQGRVITIPSDFVLVVERRH